LTPPFEIRRLERPRAALSNLSGHARLAHADRGLAHAPGAHQFWIERVDGARHGLRALTESRRVAPGGDDVASGDVTSTFERSGEAVLVER
jgi:hypothetical protein